MNKRIEHLCDRALTTGFLEATSLHILVAHINELTKENAQLEKLVRKTPRPAVEHELKVAPQFFDDVRSGKKPFEVRYNDRDFREGDILILRKWAQLGGYGQEDPVYKRITYVLNKETPTYKEPFDAGLQEGYVVLGLEAFPK